MFTKYEIERENINDFTEDLIFVRTENGEIKQVIAEDDTEVKENARNN